MFRFIPLVIAAVGGWLWQFGPLQPIQAVSNLSDPAKLRTLGERGANARLNKIVYWLAEARKGGWSPEWIIGIAQTLNRTPEPQAVLVKASLLRNLKIADELGLPVGDNWKRLRQGQAAVIGTGPYTGELVEIDHVVPYSLAPEAGNELANLEMLPRTLNRRKSDKVGDRQVAHARQLYEAGLLSQESLERVKNAAVFKPQPPASTLRR